ncbi:tryptophan halogenase family protein [Marinimicrobium alkaliphilum]|uniref:tryptophan halogenase family protein n=1 Tax=Marinimicrobium alkaliphilum TaxID=2202654 RepID=UPI000DBA7C0B|nr:tryptophan halogenase family protein [Marinimicrobium alkaliphilum]
MTQPITSVVIVGGGTAGWITAGTIAAQHQSNTDAGLRVSLVESPDIKPIGVGEGTWPTMRTTLRKMGISETDFIRECDVGFKQGAKFAKWVTGADDDFYYHPLVLPQGFMHGNLAPYWQTNGHDKSFSAAVCYQEALCENGLAPKSIATPEYEAVANYAYHLNAGKFSEFLKKHCLEKLGVNYTCDNVTRVISKDNGDIAAVDTQASGEIKGDLFIDCTGFHGLLIDKHYQVPFIDKSDVLFVDSALAAQVPYSSEDDPIASHTISTGQAAGWIWDIGLQSRRGVGHVYSSRHTDEERAAEALTRYIAQSVGEARAKELSFRKIPIRPGHRQVFWQNNCVAVGLSAGFLEPLEASALVLVELSAEMISEQMPTCREAMDTIAKRFNQTFRYRWDRIIDFLKLHYILTQRTDNDFWIDNCDPDTIPDSLNELMALWRYQHPWDHDFTSRREVFPAASYQYVLYGMGFKTESDHIRLTPQERAFAQRQLQENDRITRMMVSKLPSNRALLNKVHDYGFQKL